MKLFIIQNLPMTHLTQDESQSSGSDLQSPTWSGFLLPFDLIKFVCFSLVLLTVAASETQSSA